MSRTHREHGPVIACVTPRFLFRHQETIRFLSSPLVPLLQVPAFSPLRKSIVRTEVTPYLLHPFLPDSRFYLKFRELNMKDWEHIQLRNHLLRILDVRMISLPDPLRFQSSGFALALGITAPLGLLLAIKYCNVAENGD